MRLKSPLLNLPIINAHTHSNIHVHQITKLNGQLHFYGLIAKIKRCPCIVLYGMLLVTRDQKSPKFKNNGHLCVLLMYVHSLLIVQLPSVSCYALCVLIVNV